MTRVNVVNPKILSRRHLIAEAREIPRIPNSIASGRMKIEYIPGRYRLGKGHVKWFTTRLLWLYDRYNQVYNECRRRGYNVTYRWPVDIVCIGDYTVDDVDIKTNLDRLIERDPEFYGELV